MPVGKMSQACGISKEDFQDYFAGGTHGYAIGMQNAKRLP